MTAADDLPPPPRLAAAASLPSHKRRPLRDGAARVHKRLFTAAGVKGRCSHRRMQESRAEGASPPSVGSRLVAMEGAALPPGSARLRA